MKTCDNCKYSNQQGCELFYVSEWMTVSAEMSCLMCETKDHDRKKEADIFEVLGMSEYRQSLSERHGGCPEYVLTQRMNKIDSVFVKDFRFNTAHWDTEYFAINFERVM